MKKKVKLKKRKKFNINPPPKSNQLGYCGVILKVGYFNPNIEKIIKIKNGKFKKTTL